MGLMFVLVEVAALGQRLGLGSCRCKGIGVWGWVLALGLLGAQCPTVESATATCWNTPVCHAGMVSSGIARLVSLGLTSVESPVVGDCPDKRKTCLHKWIRFGSPLVETCHTTMPMLSI